MINKLKNKINADIHLKELLKGSSIAFVLRIIGIIAGYIFTLLITRGYGAEAMGVFALSFTLLQISSVIGRLGMDTALLRFVAEYSSQGKWDIVKNIYRKAIKLVLPFSIFVSILVFFLSPYIAEFVFKKLQLEPYFKIASIGIVPFVLLFIHTESLRGLKKIKEYMFLQQVGIFAIASIFLSIAILLMFVNSNKLLETNKVPLIIYIVAIYILSFFAYFNWKKQIGNNKVKYINLSISSDTIYPTYWTILAVSFPMLLTSMLTFIMAWTDTIMIGMLLNEKDVGVYSIALRISYIISFILFAVNSITAPKIASEFSQQNYLEFKKLSQFTSQIGIWVGIPVFIIILIFGKELLALFGKEFVFGFSSLILLSIGQFINVSVGSIGYILAMIGKQNVMSLIVFISFLINIVLNLYLIPLYGILGAAIATMISTIFWNLLGLIYLRFKYGFWNIKIGL